MYVFVTAREWNSARPMVKAFDQDEDLSALRDRPGFDEMTTWTYSRTSLHRQEDCEKTNLETGEPTPGAIYGVAS